MPCPTITWVKLIQPGAFEDQLTEVLRQGARTLLAQAVESEVGKPEIPTPTRRGLELEPNRAARPARSSVTPMCESGPH
jgi:hypothetical protein